MSRSLHVGVGTIHRLRKKFVSIVELSHGGRPRKLTPAMERSCVLDMTRGKLNTAIEATKNVQEAFGMQVCVETVRRALRIGGLQSQVKQKKPRLSIKNVKAHLDFARTHLDWTIDDWSRVISLMNLKSIDFVLMESLGVGVVIHRNCQLTLL